MAKKVDKPHHLPYNENKPFQKQFFALFARLGPLLGMEKIVCFIRRIRRLGGRCCCGESLIVPPVCPYPGKPRIVPALAFFFCRFLLAEEWQCWVKRSSWMV